MNEETKKQIYQYLKNYMSQKQEHSDYIDYYELCNLDESMSIEQIQKKINQKEFLKLFHSDQENYLDREFQSVFRECSNTIGNMQSTFSNQISKAYYDKELKEKKARNEELKRRYEKDLEKQKTRKKNTVQEKDDIPITMEEKKYLERAVETTIYKFGFYHGYMALQMALRNDFSKITNENHGRDLLKQVGVQKIRKIIEAEETNIMESNPNNMVMSFYSKIINKSGLQEKADVFYNACLQTALKYDLENNAQQTEGAIFKYISCLNMDRFTNQNVDKLELAKLSPQDVQTLIWIKMHNLGKEKSDYLFSNFTKDDQAEQVKLFAKQIQKEAKNIASQRKAM